MRSLEQVLEEARKLVEPSAEERERVRSVLDKIVPLLRQELAKRGFGDCEVSVQGSIAKDTWLPENKDIDIFVIFPKSRTKEDLEALVSNVIEIANEHNIEWTLKYAQHPYVQLHVNGFDVDVVPCFRIEPGERPITAADRTPLHTQYVLKKLEERPELRTDIRLFKRFLKVLNIYGAEIKVEGFSGYLAEVLIITYGSFIDLVKDIARRWKPGEIVLDPENHYSDKSSVRKLFKDASLIVVDPVDPNRNAAAAVSRESLSTLILGSKLLLHRPSIAFFKYSDVKLEEKDVKGRLVAPVVVLEFPYPEKLVSETVWGEVKRFLRSLWNTLERYEYKPYHIEAWSDEKSRILIFVTLESLDLPVYELHEGPPVYTDDCIKFVEKYINDPEVVGPFVRGSRLYVIKRRKYYSIERLLQAQLPQITPKHLKKLVDKVKVYRVEKIEDLENVDECVRQLVLRHMFKRPDWLTSVYMSHE